MDTGLFLSATFFAVMGFGFLIAGAALANWNNQINEFVAGVFIFICGCGFITMWGLATIKLAAQTYGL